MGLGVFFERKVSALIQDRIGANRASIFGVAALGLINTLVADPVKFLLKEDVVPAGSDRLLHFLAPILSVVPVLVTFAVIPFGDVLRVGGWVPAWGILYQPVAFVIFLTAGIAESKRIPFDLPESESELVSGYFTEYSGAKHLMFMMADFVEVVLVAALVTTLFFGGWQVPWLLRAGFQFPWGVSVALPSWAVALLQVTSFALKLIFFTWVQIVIRWTLPRFR